MLGRRRGDVPALGAGKLDARIAYRVRVHAGELFNELVGLVRASQELSPLLRRIIFSNGREAIHMTNGGRCLFGTRSTSRTGRGFSLDAIVFDEAHYLAEESLVALGFTGYARDRAPQRWYLASAVDRDVHEHGMTMSRIRERAIQAETTSLAYFEWSAAVLDDDGRELECGDVTRDQVDDEGLWHAANPALGKRVPIERVRAEREALPHRGFLTERLGIGAWWDTTEAVAAPITGEQWADLYDPDSKRVGDIVLAFDISPDRRCALVACGRRGIDDLLHVELLRSAAGTLWLVDELLRLSERFDIHSIVADSYGGNVAMIRTLEDAGLKVRALSGGEHTAACAKLLDLVHESGFRHIGQGELANALRGAKAKPLGDAWAWTRKASSGDIAAVVAMTIGLAVGSEIPTSEHQKIEIF